MVQYIVVILIRLAALAVTVRHLIGKLRHEKVSKACNTCDSDCVLKCRK